MYIYYFFFFYPQHKALYVASDESVRQIYLTMCAHRYDSCLRCVHDPYCGWDKDKKACKPYQPGYVNDYYFVFITFRSLDISFLRRRRLLQDVTNSSRAVCEGSVVNKRLAVTFGQSVHLSCFVKMPQVLKVYPVTWYHHSKEKGRYMVPFRYVYI